VDSLDELKVAFVDPTGFLERLPNLERLSFRPSNQKQQSRSDDFTMTGVRVASNDTHEALRFKVAVDDCGDGVGGGGAAPAGEVYRHRPTYLPVAAKTTSQVWAFADSAFMPVSRPPVSRAGSSPSHNYMGATPNVATAFLLGVEPIKSIDEAPSGDRFSLARLLIQKGADSSLPLTPRDLFRLVCSLNGDADADSNEISICEFKEIFRMLSFEVSNEQLEALFALCDLDDSGTISEQEFVTQWNIALQQYLASKQAQVGLSRAQIVVAVTGVTFALGFLVAFVLMAFGAWGERDIFRTLVSSSFIAGSGAGVVNTRDKSAVEGGACDELVETVIKEDKEAARTGEPVN